MFKVLVTATYCYQEGAAIHTQVIDFESKEEAKTAIEIIEKRGSASLKALALFH